MPRRDRYTDAQIVCMFHCLFGDEAAHALDVLAAERARLAEIEGLVLQLPAGGAHLVVLERAMIVATLEQVGGVQRRAAKRLGISARRLNYMMATHAIPRAYDGEAPRRRPGPVPRAHRDRFTDPAEPAQSAGQTPGEPDSAPVVSRPDSKEPR